MDELINNFLTEQGINTLSTTLVFSRLDGIPLHVYSESNTGSEDTLSALSAASWQAAEGLIKTMPVEHLREDDFRFSFDTSSCGVYIQKLNLEEPMIMTAIYHDQLNPAKLKSQVRRLKIIIEDNREQLSVSKETDFLFDDISDDEMDNLFSNVVG